MQGVTINETIYGNPGERRILSAGRLVGLTPASNLPNNSRIKYWAYQLPGHQWPKDIAQWAKDVGVGLQAEDVDIIDYTPEFPRLK